MRSVFRYRKALGPPSGQAVDLAREAEFDGIDDAAFARPVGSRNREGAPAEVDVELADAPHFLYVSGLELDHFRSPPAGREKIRTKSSTFGFLPLDSRI